MAGARPVVDGAEHGGQASRHSVVAVPVSLVQPGSAVTPSVVAPSTEAQVAARLIATIDAQSGGRYTIRATADNVALLDTWMDNEGGLWADNPLNTSLDASRYPHQFTAAGQDTRIPIFPDIQMGIDATATTLLSSGAYSAILSTLSEGTATCEVFAVVVMASPWAASHYGGNAAHFCGNQGNPGTPGTVVTACLRVGDRSSRVMRRSERMPGVCGRRATHTGLGHRAAGGDRQRRQHKADGSRPPLHHRPTRVDITTSRLARPVPHHSLMAGAAPHPHRR
jgi:hypothetical protein